MARAFPLDVANYGVENFVTVNVPFGKTEVLITLDETVSVSGDGSEAFILHPTDSLEARTFDVTSVSTLTFNGRASIGLIWT